jgi:xanthine dehydrogenase YagS FAD-binding subunit
MKLFQHLNASTVDEAVALLKKYKDKARLIAGGTDLLSELKNDIVAKYPEVLINIKSISGLDYVRKTKTALKIGALTRLSDIVASSLLATECKVLVEAAKSVATPQIRNMGTIGGNLTQDTRCWYYRYPKEIGGSIICRRKGGRSCSAVAGDNRYHAIFPTKHCFAVCPSDTAVALAALDAKIKIVSPGGSRTLPVADFYQPLGNALATDEMVTEIQIPRILLSTRQIFTKYRLREAVDFAIVSVAMVVILDNGICRDARIVLGAVAPGPFRAVKSEQLLLGKSIDGSIAKAAAIEAIADAKPLSRNAYKVQIAKTLVERALLS